MDAHWKSWPGEDCFALEVGRYDTNETEAGPYKNLSREHNAIRLVKILPGNPWEPIRCRIASFPLDDAPMYTALSYTWGRPDRDCTIDLNGRCMGARKNLWRFMHQIRKLPAWRDVMFWIDAICISQSDNKERTHQVALMAQIYGGAAQVLVWLGPEYRHAGAGFKALRNMNEHSLPIDEMWQGRHGHGFRRLCARSYWTRLWVVQELVLADEVSLLCGEEHLPWDVFLIAVDLVIQQEINTETKTGTTSAAASMIAQIKQARALDSLFNQVLASAHLRCTEPKDKIFALLGIVEHGHEDIRPDYDLPFSDLLNIVLRSQHHHEKPSSLHDVKDHCHKLASAVGVAPGLIFSVQDWDMKSKQYPQIYSLHDGETGLSYWWAIHHGHESIRSLWIQENSDIPLFKALAHLASLGEESACQRLLETGHLNIGGERSPCFDEFSPNAVYEAAMRGFTDIIALLLSHCKPQPTPTLLETAIERASAHGHTKTVSFLLDQRIKVLPYDSRAFLLGLRSAVVNSHPKLLKVLIANAHRYILDNVDIKTLSLMFFRDSGEPEFRILLSGINALRKGSAKADFSTILHQSMTLKRPDVFHRLLQDDLVTKKEVNSVDTCETHLARAIRLGFKREACQLILRPDVDINKISMYRWEHCSSEAIITVGSPRTPLALAIQNYSTEIVSALLRRDDVKLCSGSTVYPLVAIASLCKFPDRWRLEASGEMDADALDERGEPIMEMLIQHLKLDVNAKTWQGKGALALALVNRNESIAELLLCRKDLDVNETDCNGSSMLSLAIEHGYHRVVQRLLERRDLRNISQHSYGRSAFMLTAEACNRARRELALDVPQVRGLLDGFDDFALLHADSECITSSEDAVQQETPALRSEAAYLDPKWSKYRSMVTQHKRIVKSLLEREDFMLSSEDREIMEDNAPGLYENIIRRGLCFGGLHQRDHWTRIECPIP